MTRFLCFAIFSLLLTACSHNPASYLPTGTQPIVNIEAQIHDQIELEAHTDRLSVKNRTHNALVLFYKLFWYDQFGVTQSVSDTLPWQEIGLNAGQKRALELTKPTEESVNYRIYMRGQR